MFPLVTDLADKGVPVVLSCRVLGFSKQAYFKWRANPVTQRDWDDAHLINIELDVHHDDSEKLMTSAKADQEQGIADVVETSTGAGLEASPGLDAPYDPLRESRTVLRTRVE